jgi:hypothetical protein
MVITIVAMLNTELLGIRGKFVAVPHPLNKVPDLASSM